MKKYSKFLTILLVILTISLIILVGYAIYTVYDNYSADKSAEDLLTQFESDYEIGDVSDPADEEDPNVQEPSGGQNTSAGTQTTNKQTSSSGGGSSYRLGTYYKDKYKVIGMISIPKLNIQYPIFNVDNTDTLRVGTAGIYPINIEETLNVQGNAVIAGHNYRNSRMFSKLYTLKSGDSVYITNIYGYKLEYKVYNVYQTTDSDFTYATRDTNGSIEVSLTTCTSDAKTRTIVWARAE